MSIVRMKRLRLVGLRADRESLLAQLQELGCVQIDETPPGQDDPALAALARPSAQALEEAKARRDQALAALDILTRAAPEKKGLLDPLPEVTREQLFQAAGEKEAGAVCAWERDAAQLDAEAGKLLARRKSLEPWLKLDVPLDTPSTASVSAIFGALPAQTGLDEAQKALGGAGELCQLTGAGQDRDSLYVFLLCHKSVQDAALDALQGLGFTRVTFRDMSGTAAENDARLRAQYEENRKQAEQLRAQVAQQSGSRRELELCADRSAQDVRREEARLRMLESGEAFFLLGWFPAPEEARVAKLLDAQACAWECADPTPEEYPQVPIQLKNGKFSRCMNTITEMYSMPAYDGIDPNPLMFPFFVVFFGMMMADMAYGILMIAGALLFLKKKKPQKPYFMEGVLWCGISTFVWGAVTGGFLGDFIPQLLRVLNPQSTFEMPALFTPLNDTIAILLGSLVLGAIQVFTGMTISVIKKVKDGAFMDALFDEITWWIILAGAGLAITGIAVGTPLLLAGALMLALGGTRNAKGFGKLTSLVGLVYNGVTGFFSDILSYMRLMALMLAGSVIAQVFNTLGSVFGNVLVFIVISLVGNALNLALNLLGCYVHDLRLQCLEFFNRFYKEGGRPFRPLNIETAYVSVRQDPT